jgi:thioesterase domain-containing protein/malonyl CoA-acyl carrier protein transacylase/acyl carrier protein
MFAGPERLEAASRELERPQWLQPALFACDWALARLWFSWGVKPEALLGHSLGEYVAACLAGIFSLEDALTLVVTRARVAEQLPPGGMLSVLAPAAELEPLLGAELSLAAINGPASCVLSGPLGALESIEHTLVARGLSCKRVRYSRAMHSSMFDPYLADFERVVARVKLGAPKLPVVSSVTGQWLSEREATDPAYWVRHLRHTVRFSDALALLLAQEERALIEVGPGTILGSLARQHPARTSQPVISSLPSVTAQETSPLAPLGEAWLAGVQVDWEHFRAGERRRRVPLPTYSFDRERYWIQPVTPAPATRRAEPLPPPSPSSSRRTARRDTPVEPAHTGTEQALVECFRELFRIEELGIHDDFFALGGDSLLALKLTARISERLGVRLALQAVVEAPTVAALAKRLGDTGAPRTARPKGLIQLQEGTQGRPLFFVHAGGGQSLFYRELARCIDASRPVYAFESVGLEEPGRCHGSVEEMAAHYLEGLRSVQPAGPYLLIGASFGGMIAYEMARRLSAEGHAVPLCAQLDTPGPRHYAGRFTDEADLLSYVMRGRLELPPERLRGLSPEAQLQRVLEEAERAGIEELGADPERGRRVLQVWKANTLALSRYEIPRWEQGELQYFRAAERHVDLPEHPELEWIGRGASVRVDVVPGGHTSMLQPPHVERLAAHLRASLERARA